MGSSLPTMAQLSSSTLSDYRFIWDDKGSGAHHDVGLWYPHDVPEGYFVVGGYAQGNHDFPNSPIMIVKVVVDDPSAPLLAEPTRWERIWHDRGSGAKHRGSLWRAIPPPNYVTLGDVAVEGWDWPGHDSIYSNFRCVNHNLVVQTQDVTKIWDDKGSGTKEDVTIWRITPTNVLHAEDRHRDRPQDPVYVLKSV